MEIKEKVKERWGNDIDKPGKITWEMKMSMSGSDQHALLYRSVYKGYGIQMEVITPCTEHCGMSRFGESKTYFFVDGVKKRFMKLETMLKHIDKLGESA